MNHRLSLTEYVVIIILLFVLAQGAASLYERGLLWLNEATAERMNQASEYGN